MKSIYMVCIETKALRSSCLIVRRSGVYTHWFCAGCIVCGTARQGFSRFLGPEKQSVFRTFKQYFDPHDSDSLLLSFVNQVFNGFSI